MSGPNNPWLGMTNEQVAQQLQQMQQDNLYAQQQRIQKMAQEREALKGQPLPVDYSAIAGFFDDWAGTNVARSMPKVETAADRQRTLHALEQAMAQAEGGLGDDQRSLLQLYQGQMQDQAKMAQADKHHNDRNAVDWAKIRAVTGKQAATQQPKPTQFLAATYGRRMEDANAIMDSILSDPKNLELVTSGTGAAQRFGPEAFQGTTIKSLSQAERNFVNSILRRESGAAISKEEFASAEKQYFPRFGDTPETLAQKAQNRRRVIEGLRLEAGDAWDQYSPLDVGSQQKKIERTVNEGENKDDLVKFLLD